MCKTTTKDCEFVAPENDKRYHVATVEEALSMTGFGKYNMGLLLVCSWTLQAMGMDMFGTSFVVAAAVCDLQLTMQQRGLLTAMPLLGVVAGAQLWGYISDTKGRRLTLVLSMSIGFVFAALSSLSPNWETMAVLKLISSTLSWDARLHFVEISNILGFLALAYIVWFIVLLANSTSASNSGAYTLLGESCSERVRGKLMLLCTCSLMCSQAAVAVFAYPILPLDFSYWIDFLGIVYRPWRLLALAMALPCAITAGLLQLFHESPIFLASQGRYEEALHVLRRIYATNIGTDCFPVKKLVEDKINKASQETSFFGSVWQQTTPLFRFPMLKETLRLFYLVAVIYMTGSGFILWLPYIMNNLFSVLEIGGGDGLNLCAVIRYSTQDAIMVSGNNSTDIPEICDDTIQGTTLLSAIVYGALASCSNLLLSLTCGNRKRNAMICIIVMSASSAVLLNVVPVPIAGGIFFFFFIMCALCMGILSVYFVELYPTSVRGMVSCLSVMLGRMSAFLGVNAIGLLISTNCEATFYGWSLLLISALAVAWFLPRDRSNK